VDLVLDLVLEVVPAQEVVLVLQAVILIIVMDLKKS